MAPGVVIQAGARWDGSYSSSSSRSGSGVWFTRLLIPDKCSFQKFYSASDHLHRHLTLKQIMTRSRRIEEVASVAVCCIGFQYHHFRLPHPTLARDCTLVKFHAQVGSPCI